MTKVALFALLVVGCAEHKKNPACGPAVDHFVDHVVLFGEDAKPTTDKNADTAYRALLTDRCGIDQWSEATVTCFNTGVDPRRWREVLHDVVGGTAREH